MTMTSTLVLRIASAVSFLFAAGHTLGGRKEWSPLGETEVLTAMRTVHMAVMGVDRTYLDFYMGFGYCLSVAMVLQSVLLWQLASLARVPGVSVRPMIAAFTVASLASTALAWRFIFPVPALFSLVLTAVLVVAFVVAR
jgi:hypothetical protein